MTTQPAIFLSHGTPQIILDTTPAHDFLVELGQTLSKPSAIIVFSAHWETHGLKIMATESPKTIYDFGGFDPVLYTMTYPAQGAPELAQKIQNMLRDKEIDSAIDTLRGLDHGAWIPLKLMCPDANIPVLQISIPRGISPEEISKIGRLLSILRRENILFIGSGSFTHNLYEFRGQAVDGPPAPWAKIFADWMTDKLSRGDTKALLDYRNEAPNAVENHPTEEHLLPLFAMLGAGNMTPPKHIHSSYNHAILAMDAFQWDE